jgi:hypothetical protein
MILVRTESPLAEVRRQTMFGHDALVGVTRTTKRRS